MYVGAKIKDYRIRNGLTQDAIAELLNISRVSVLNMEAGRHRVSLDNIFILCGIFKCLVGDLLPPVKSVKIKVIEKTVTIKREKKIKSFKIIK